MFVDHINEQEGAAEEEDGEDAEEGEGGQQQPELPLRLAPRLLRTLPCRLQRVSAMRGKTVQGSKYLLGQRFSACFVL